MKRFKPSHLAVAATTALVGWSLPAAAVDFFWASGNFLPGTTAPSPLAAGDTLFVQTAAAKTFAGVAFTNDGTVAWAATSSNINFSAAAAVVNNGLWDAQGDATLAYAGSGTTSFTNNGTLRKSGGTGVTLLGGTGFGFTNNGTVEAQTGTVRFTGGPMAFNAGSVFTGAGSVEVAASATFTGAFTSDNLRLTGGTQTGAGAVLNGQATWTAGTLDGTWQVGAGQTLVLSGGAAKSITGNNTVVTNDGTVAWAATSSNINFSAAAAVVNNGLWDAQGDATLAYAGSGTTSFTNNGTLRKSGGTGVTLLGGTGFGFTNNGTVEAQTGTVRFTGGPMAFNVGSVFTGAGSVEVADSATFTGAFTSDNLRLTGGTQTGAGAVLNGQATWTAGTLDGTWQVGAGQTLVLSGGAAKSITGNNTVVTNDGTVAWAATSSNINFSAAAAVVNNGLWDAQGDATLAYAGSGTTSFTNNGTLRKSGGTGVTLLGGTGFGFTNNGTVEAQTGTVRFTGGPMAFNVGSVFTGAGSVEVADSATFTGAFTSDNLRLTGGTQTGAGAVLNGQATWTAGTLDGTWQVGAGQTLILSSGAAKTITGASTVFTNDGTVAWAADSSNLNLSASAGVVNNGVFDAQGDSSVVYAGSGATSFVNQGRFVKSGGNGNTRVDSFSLGFSNPGTVDVQTGTIFLPSDFTNHGTLTGDGRFSTAGALTNDGIVAPGSAGLGTLTLLGNVVQSAAGTMAFDLATLGSVDFLSINGNAFLDGTLALNCFGACSFDVGDSFTILDAGTTLGGSFAAVTLSGFATGAFDVVYDMTTTSVSLVVTQAVTAVPEPGTYALLIAGLAAVGWRVRRTTIG